jgi:hypothetical protein
MFKFLYIWIGIFLVFLFLLLLFFNFYFCSSFFLLQWALSCIFTRVAPRFIMRLNYLLKKK